MKAMSYDHQNNTGLPAISISRSDIAWMTTRRIAKGVAATLIGTLPVLIKYGDTKTVLLSTAIAAVVLGGDKLINETRKAQGKRTLMDILSDLLTLIIELYNNIKSKKKKKKEK